MKRYESGTEHHPAVAPKILLTDTCRWSIGARLAIALTKAGCHVFAVCPTQRHPLQFTRVVRQLFPYSSIRPLDSLRNAIKEVQPNFVIPCDERGVRHLHELFLHSSQDGSAGAEIASLIERSLGASKSYPIVSSRNDLLQLAREEGIRVPSTLPIKEMADLKSWEENQEFPCMLKADSSFGGTGVEMVRSREHAQQCFERLTGPHGITRVLKRLIINRDPFWIRPWWNRHRPAIIAQAFVQGRPANCAVACWEGRVLAGIGVEVVSSSGSTGPAIIVRVVENSEMSFAAERIARRLNLSGFFGLDFMIENGTGATYLIEMNPRSTPLCHLQLGKGRDMVGALSAQLSGQSLRDIPPTTENELIAYFPQAWTPNHELLPSSFQDIPSEEPELVHELLRPWPDRTLLYRLSHALTSPRTQKS
ncbi:MAG TPA: ATP-grasp domain-containing protein [Candidatus Dormibacteraeota bacterium]|jgi:hypothetical protein|nr:ATP-grasp domain-containing protein [Candidatus Dormibacteraeota bacterium]